MTKKNMFTAEVVERTMAHTMSNPFFCCVPTDAPLACGRVMAALAMQDHEVVIAFTLIRRVPRPSQSDWLGCCVLSCKVHDEDDLFVYAEFATLLDDDAKSIRRHEERILKLLDWRVPIDYQAYRESYLQLLENVPANKRCVRGS